jgi:hypothetical protein
MAEQLILDPEQQLKTIRLAWEREALAFRVAGLTLRGCLTGEDRMQAVQQRFDCIVSSDALCDAYNDIRAGVS